MKRGGTGGANTYTGLLFEKRVRLERLLDRLPDYQVRESGMAGKIVTYEVRDVARHFEKYGFYRFLEEQGDSSRVGLCRSSGGLRLNRCGCEKIESPQLHFVIPAKERVKKLGALTSNGGGADESGKRRPITRR